MTALRRYWKCLFIRKNHPRGHMNGGLWDLTILCFLYTISRRVCMFLDLFRQLSVSPEISAVYRIQKGWLSLEGVSALVLGHVAPLGIVAFSSNVD